MAVSNIIYDRDNGVTFKRGRFLGKGGFASCYEITNMRNNNCFAGKILSKANMVNAGFKSSVMNEIDIHRHLNHPNIVKFYGTFEDDYNIYILLELCTNRSLQEIQNRRKVITEPETKFYLKQILSGVNYLHHNRIIHRDLKLDNIFLTKDFQVKIGDFNIATVIRRFQNHLNNTHCGTPGYMPPEIEHQKGHSFEADIWATGCIMYTLLTGKLPFPLTINERERREKLRRGQYTIPREMSQLARDMIQSMLQVFPENRLRADELLNHRFLRSGYCPQALPSSSLTMAPRYEQFQNVKVENHHYQYVKQRNDYSIVACLAGDGINHVCISAQSVTILRNLMAKVLRFQPVNCRFVDEMTDPAAHPLIWVSKWVDYSDKYGFSYELSDTGLGVLFNDSTKLTVLPDRFNIHYVDKRGKEFYVTAQNYPNFLSTKIKILSYFCRYMQERELIRAEGDNIRREIDTLARTPHLIQWCRLSASTMMVLSNGTIQINFTDHTKIIMCPLMAAITYIGEDKMFKTFRFSSLAKYGCNVTLYQKIRYAYDNLTTFLNQ